MQPDGHDLRPEDQARAPIRIVLFGFGVIGRAVVRVALRRPGLRVHGIVVRRPELEGRSARELVQEAPPDLRLSVDGAAVLDREHPDVVVVATRSSIGEVLPQLRLAAAAGASILCTAEDLAFITPSDGPEAREVFALAEAHRVSIVAVGLNPGFVLDVWPLTLASVAHDVESIDAERVVDLSEFGPAVRASLGVGYWPAEFERELARGAIAGHRGFRESLRLIGEALERRVEETRVETSPILARHDRTLTDGTVLAGQTAGVSQVALGFSSGTPWLRLTMTASVALDEIPADPVDRVHIAGSTELTAVISPGTSAVAGTAGRVANAIPAVAAARPGVLTALDLGITPPRFVPPDASG
jgi:2,4-diaminopentanoate dehydrogenase